MLRQLHEEYARTRDKAIRNRLAEMYMPIASAIAARRSGPGGAREDMKQAAMIGLLNALDRFDPDRGVEFITFAWTTINGQLKMHRRSSAWAVRVPRSLQELSLKVERAVDQLSTRLGRSPTIAEVAEWAGVTEEEVLSAQEVRHAYAPVSLDLGDDAGPRPSVSLAHDDSRLARVEERALVAPVIARLPARERRILHLRFVDQLSQSEIAKLVGVSQMQVSRSLSRSLAQLREWLADEPLPTPPPAPRRRSSGSVGGSSVRVRATTTGSTPGRG
jgi:RNA polymerase sigma-B factor